MSRHQTIKAIKDEIAELNKIIDMKIIRGFSYAIEARRHKILMHRLSQISGRRASIFNSFASGLGLTKIFGF